MAVYKRREADLRPFPAGPDQYQVVLTQPVKGSNVGPSTSDKQRSVGEALRRPYGTGKARGRGISMHAILRALRDEPPRDVF